MSAITEKGFLRPTYAQLLAALGSRAREVFGEEMDTGEFSALGKFLRIIAYELAGLYEDLEGVYFARFPGYAAGVNLDRLMPFAGLRRQPAEAAVFNVRFTGAPGGVVTEGTRVATAAGVTFRAAGAAVLDEKGQADAKVVCAQAGPAGNVDAAAIRVLVDTSAEVFGAEGLGQLALGRGAETDSELRARFNAAVGGIGSATAIAIRAAVLRLDGVTSCLVAENDTGASDAENRPPHSFEVYVLGTAADEEIARAIFSKKPLGVRSHGNCAATVTDEAGVAHEVRFSRVEEVALRLRGTLRVDALFPEAGTLQVQTALAQAVGGYACGQDLVFTALLPLIYSVPGVVDVEGLAVSADGGESWRAGNIPVHAAQAVRLAPADIELEVADYEDR